MYPHFIHTPHRYDILEYCYLGPNLGGESTDSGIARLGRKLGAHSKQSSTIVVGKAGKADGVRLNSARLVSKALYYFALAFFF